MNISGSAELSDFMMWRSAAHGQVLQRNTTSRSIIPDIIYLRTIKISPFRPIHRSPNWSVPTRVPEYSSVLMIIFFMLTTCPEHPILLDLLVQTAQSLVKGVNYKVRIK